jgi:hypothetical protein
LTFGSPSLFSNQFKGRVMNHFKSLVAGAAFALFSISSFAQTATPKVDAREVKQDARIQQGVASGQLNAKETYRLEKEQANINRVEAKAKADGKVTQGERHHLKHLQNKASKDIYRQKHDAQKIVKP